MATKRSLEQRRRQSAIAARLVSRLSRRGAKSALFRRLSGVPGVSGEADFYRKLSGEVHIGRGLLTTICNELEPPINPAWLLTGRGPVERPATAGPYHSTAEVDAINARAMASDREYWQQEFSGPDGLRRHAGSLATHLDLALRQLRAVPTAHRLPTAAVKAMERLRDQLVEEVVLQWPEEQHDPSQEQIR